MYSHGQLYYLICTGDTKAIEQRHKDLCSDGGHDGVGEGKEPECCTISVGLRRSANDRDPRHETGSEGHGNWHCCHLTATQQELGTAVILTASESLKEPNASSPQDHPGKHHIVPD